MNPALHSWAGHTESTPSLTTTRSRKVVRTPRPGCATQPSSGRTFEIKPGRWAHAPTGRHGESELRQHESHPGGIKAREKNWPGLGAERTRACRSGDWQTVSVKSQIDVLILVGCAVALSVSTTQLCSCRAGAAISKTAMHGVTVCQ